MPAITERSTKPPLLKLKRLSHGTLECTDLAKTRRFYEEVLGIECIQTGPRSLMTRLGSDHVYVVIETPRAKTGMPLQNHNGLDVETPEDVEVAHEAIMSIKDEWGLQRVQGIAHAHGDTSFYFQDFDGNWWEILAPRPGGYLRDFDEKDDGYDITGRYELDGQPRFHTHDPKSQEQAVRGGADE